MKNYFKYFRGKAYLATKAVQGGCTINLYTPMVGFGDAVIRQSKYEDDLMSLASGVCSLFFATKGYPMPEAEGVAFKFTTAKEALKCVDLINLYANAADDRKELPSWVASAIIDGWRPPKNWKPKYA